MGEPCFALARSYYNEPKIINVGLAGTMCHQFMLSIAKKTASLNGFVSKSDFVIDDIKGFAGIILSDTTISEIERAFHQCLDEQLLAKVFFDDGEFRGYEVAYFSEYNELLFKRVSKMKRTEQRKKTEQKKASISEDAQKVVEFFHRQLMSYKKDRRDINEKTKINWGIEIDRMIRIDKRQPRRICEVIKWVFHGDDFWAPNIQSADKLRKHFDRLEMKMEKVGWRHNSADAIPKGLSLREGESVTDAIKRHERDNLAPRSVIAKWKAEIENV